MSFYDTLHFEGKFPCDNGSEHDDINTHTFCGTLSSGYELYQINTDSQSGRTASHLAIILMPGQIQEHNHSSE